MTAPPRTRRRPAPKDRPTSNNTRAQDSTAKSDEFDFDRRVVDQVDSSIWTAIFAGHFRLAVRCDICGRWLTDGRSKRAHMGPRCAAKAGG